LVPTWEVFPKSFFSFALKVKSVDGPPNDLKIMQWPFLLKQKHMGATIITTEDLMEFKGELLEDIKALLKDQNGQQGKKWLKSNEVRDLLGISPGTLQNLRINGTLPYTKIGGVLYYEYHEIMEVLEKNKIHNRI